MCGIFAIVNLRNDPSTSPLVEGTELINHRGPDDEGYLLWKQGMPEKFAGSNTAISSIEGNHLSKIPNHYDWKVGLGHKRLSILDLSWQGHQPMVDPDTGISVCFNGEIYNYIELREELIKSGFKFHSQSDTEVLLKAWIKWGVESINKLIGMYAFLILDPSNGGTLYAVRDRYGIKPLYYYKNNHYFSFASEIKQLKTLPEYSFKINQEIVVDYLNEQLLDHTNRTFDSNIFQVNPGEYIRIDLTNYNSYVESYYHLKLNLFKGSEEEAAEEFYRLFKDSIKLQLRADVPIGSCLSGGLDSSSIVCMIREVMNDFNLSQDLKTITSCFKEKEYDEYHFAEAVNQKANATSFQVWPDTSKLESDFQKILWHMDEPFASTSQFSQWCVFEAASRNGLKVMLDGQGSDEFLAGYNGNELPLYNTLINNFRFFDLLAEIKSFKAEHGFFPKSQLNWSFKNFKPFGFLNYDNNFPLRGRYKNKFSLPLRENLIKQTFETSLPCLLRYEDRNSMAFSIESRVPFLDHRLVEFALSLPSDFILKRGLRKVILRKSMESILPDKINKRRDKMGFVTPEKNWLSDNNGEWIRSGIKHSLENYRDYIPESIARDTNNILNKQKNFSFLPWRVFCLGKWIEAQHSSKTLV